MRVKTWPVPRPVIDGDHCRDAHGRSVDQEVRGALHVYRRVGIAHHYGRWIGGQCPPYMKCSISLFVQSWCGAIFPTARLFGNKLAAFNEG